MKLKLIPPLKGGFLLGFSGGADSVVLLDLLLETGQRVELFHLDHRLRDTSVRDASFCQELARKKGLIIHSYSIDVEGYCRDRGLGIEEGARKLRYQLLHEIKEKRSLDYIATGHHLDDQMETFFINLFRGSGSQGLGAIHPLRGELYRPLLFYRKEEILAYAKKRGLAYVSDETNFLPIYKRNKIRLELIPLIEKDYSNSLGKRLLQTTEILREERDFIDEELEKRLDLKKDLYSLEEISALPRVLKKALLRKKFSLSFAQTAEALDILEGRSLGEKLYKEGLLRKEQDYFYLGPHLSPREVFFNLKMGTNTFEGYTIKLTKSSQAVFTRNLHSIPLSCLEEGLVLRTRKPGDVFSPSGLRGSKKLKDFFIDEKIPRSERDNYLLLASGKRVFWILGLRKSQITEKSPEYIQVFIENEEELV